MSLISIEHLTFCYEGNYEDVFTDVSVQLDTDWKLGLTGRNGRGKTTLLRLLAGQLPHGGAIRTSVAMDYFPFMVQPCGTAGETLREMIAPYGTWEREMEHCLQMEQLERYGQLLEQYMEADGYTINYQIREELARLEVREEVLSRPWETLSGGERGKLMLAALFLRKGRFLLIDEPTDHLDTHGRQVVAAYLRSKKGFLLVSHDRAFLDACIDHVLSIGKHGITVQQGNYSTWEENCRRQQQEEMERDAQLKKEIKTLTQAAQRAAQWSHAAEKEKKGQQTDRRASGLRPDRGYLGSKAAKMMKRSKTIATRREQAVEEKRELLKEVEEVTVLKLHQLPPPGPWLAEVKDLSIAYGGEQVCRDVRFLLEPGQRIALVGDNGTGKSSLLRLLMGETVPHSGVARLASGVRVSYVCQDTSGLRGNLMEYIKAQGLEVPLCLAILRKLDFPRAQLEKPMEQGSEGQKKKILLACSLAKPAHLLIWDEPLNYVDVLSRGQLEELLLREAPTMLFVEHDVRFREKIATQTVQLG